MNHAGHEETPLSGLTFEPEGHIYTLDGAVVPSVTQILKTSGLIDFSHIPPSTLAAAMKRGTTVHAAIHAANEADLDVTHFYATFPAWAGYLRAWFAFNDTAGFHPLVCEHRIASRRSRVAGTLDVLGTMNNHAALIDYKTAVVLESVCPDLQLAAYDALAREWAKDDQTLRAFFDRYPYTRRYAIQLRKDGTYRLEEYTNPRAYLEFRTLVETFHIVAARRRNERAARVA